MTNEEAIKNIVAYMYYAVEDIPEEVGKAFDKAVEALKNEERLINEYISKVNCCDECFASVYCTVNGLRESCVPQAYCVKNIKRYFGDKVNPKDNEKGDAE